MKNLASVLICLWLGTATGGVAVAEESELRPLNRGLAFSLDELRDLYSLVANDEHTLISLSLGKDGILVLGQLIANGNSFNSLYRFDADTSLLIRGAGEAELGLAPVSAGGIQKVILLYRRNLSSNYNYKKEVWLQTFAIGRDGKAVAGVAEKVAETNYQTKGADPDDPWWFSSGDTDPNSEVRLFLRDVNRDGEPDLVIWTKVCFSKLKSEPVDGDRGGNECPAGFRLYRYVARVKLATKEGWGEAVQREGEERQPVIKVWDSAFGSYLFMYFL